MNEAHGLRFRVSCRVWGLGFRGCVHLNRELSCCALQRRDTLWVGLGDSLNASQWYAHTLKGVRLLGIQIVHEAGSRPLSLGLRIYCSVA